MNKMSKSNLGYLEGKKENREKVKVGSFILKCNFSVF